MDQDGDGRIGRGMDGMDQDGDGRIGSGLDGMDEEGDGWMEGRMDSWDWGTGTGQHGRMGVMRRMGGMGEMSRMSGMGRIRGRVDLDGWDVQRCTVRHMKEMFQMSLRWEGGGGDIKEGCEIVARLRTAGCSR